MTKLILRKHGMVVEASVLTLMLVVGKWFPRHTFFENWNEQCFRGSTDHLSRVAGGTRFSRDSNSAVIESNSIFGTSVCVGDPAATIILCEGMPFLAIIHINDIIIDFKSCIDIDVKLLMEPTVAVQFQICQIIEVSEVEQSPWRN
jgi:hypothetical protein